MGGRFHRNTHGRIVLKNLRKTDGQEREIQGVRVYALWIEGEAEFSERCYWIIKRAMAGANHFSTVSYQEGQRALAERSGWDQFKPGTLKNQIHRYNVAQKGEKLPIRGVVLFEKRERGWHLLQVQELVVNR